VDLSEVGVQIVVDNIVARHVLTSLPLDDNQWVPHNHTKLYVREEHFSSSTDEVINKIFTPIPSKEPEHCNSFHNFMFLPKAAALFALHDMKLHASAEHGPPRVILDDNGELHKIFEGALVLYHCDLPSDDVLAIEALEKVNCVVADLEQWSCNTLLRVVQMWWSGGFGERCRAWMSLVLGTTSGTQVGQLTRCSILKMLWRTDW
jgi:hypothetical protein